MSNDAKLGLVVGIAVVILIAIVFYRKDATLAHTAPDAKAPAHVQPASIVSIPPAAEPGALAPLTTAPSETALELATPAPIAPRTRSR